MMTFLGLPILLFTLRFFGNSICTVIHFNLRFIARYFTFLLGLTRDAYASRYML